MSRLTTVSAHNGSAKSQHQSRWASRIWIFVADVAGLTALLSVIASPLLGYWLIVLLACGPLAVALAFWALQSDKPEPQVTPTASRRRRVSDIRIVITPRLDEYGY